MQSSVNEVSTMEEVMAFACQHIFFHILKLISLPAEKKSEAKQNRGRSRTVVEFIADTRI